MLRFAEITSNDGLDLAYRFRYDAYCLDRGFLRSDDYPDCRETDALDEHARHFAAYAGDDHTILRGYCRLILPNRHGFPFERHFHPVELDRATMSMEFSRLIVHPQIRGRSRDVVLGLVRLVYQCAMAERLEYCYAVLDRPLLRLLRTMGLGFEVEHGPAWVMNSECLLALLSRSSLDTVLAAQNAELLAYLRSPGCSD